MTQAYRVPIPFALCGDSCAQGTTCVTEVNASGPVGVHACLPVVDLNSLADQANWGKALVVREPAFETYDRDVSCKAPSCKFAAIALKVRDEYWPVRVPQECDLLAGRSAPLRYPGEAAAHVIGIVKPTDIRLDGQVQLELLAYESSPAGPFVRADAHPASYVVTKKLGSGPHWGAN